MKRVKELITLEECLKASLGYDYEQDYKNIGEYHVLKQFSNRVYPALDGDNSNTMDYSMERQIKVEDIGRREMGVSSMRRSQSDEKVKKRVSFRLPQEADIIIFYSPKDYLTSERGL